MITASFHGVDLSSNQKVKSAHSLQNWVS